MSLLAIAAGLIEKIIPDPKQKAAAKLKLAELEQQGQLKEQEVMLSAIIMEAKSKDPWTSRARPSFLYVIYIMILFSVPMGILSSFEPQAATDIASGMKSWLGAIPAELWYTFGAGYLGYTGFRSSEKKGIANMSNPFKNLLK